jgi:hypothetical protein
VQAKGWEYWHFASGVAYYTIYRFNRSAGMLEFYHFSLASWVDLGFSWIFSPVVFTVEFLVNKSRKHPVDATVGHNDAL